MTTLLDNPLQLILGFILIASSLGVILSRKPVHASLWFLLTLFSLAIFYLQLSAHFIAVMQVLVYAGAILVIFMFVIILFQDAYQKIALVEAKSSRALIVVSASAFLLVLAFLGRKLVNLPLLSSTISGEFGTVQSLGEILYLDFFFPFEAVIFLFLVAIIGALYMGKKVV